MREHRAQHGRPKRFNLELNCDGAVKDNILAKLKDVKTALIAHSGSGTNNTAAIEHLLEFWEQHHGQDYLQPQPQMDRSHSYVTCSPQEVNQPMFLTTSKAIQNLVDQVSRHRATCHAELQLDLKASSGHPGTGHAGTGHSAHLIWKCLRDHKMQWDTSPHLPNGRALVDYRVYHAYLSTGFLPVQYERFCDTLQIGCTTQYMRDQLAENYTEAVHVETEESCHRALDEELACDEAFESIGIVTDARHGWRRNSRQTDVVAIGVETHKVLRVEVVTKDDDSVSQRHELLGTQRLYNYFEAAQDGDGVKIKVHAHDRNASVNKYIKKNHKDTTNQNDTWHVTKSFEKAIKPVTGGPASTNGKTWHEELFDKLQSARTHAHWAMRNCQGDAMQLRKYLRNMVQHYKNIHDDCHETSRCHVDSNYLPSKVIIQSPEAEKIFLKAIMNTAIYKDAESFVLAMDTFYVESFNNCLNVYHDKRIAFGHQQYQLRTNLAILHWNENINREYTSVWTPFAADIVHPRQMQGKKTYKPHTFHFKRKIWNRFMDMVFGH